MAREYINQTPAPVPGRQYLNTSPAQKVAGREYIAPTKVPGRKYIEQPFYKKAGAFIRDNVFQPMKESAGMGADIVERLSPVETIRNNYAGFKSANEARLKNPEAISPEELKYAFDAGFQGDRGRKTWFEKASNSSITKADGSKDWDVIRKGVGRGMELPTYFYSGAKGFLGNPAGNLGARVLNRTTAVLPEAVVNTGIQQFEQGNMQNIGQNFAVNTVVMSGLSNAMGEAGRKFKRPNLDTSMGVEKSIAAPISRESTMAQRKQWMDEQLAAGTHPMDMPDINGRNNFPEKDLVEPKVDTRNFVEKFDGTHLTSGEAQLRKLDDAFGNEGSQVANQINEVARKTTALKSTWLEQLNKNVKNLTPEAGAKVSAALESPQLINTLSKLERNAYDSLDKVRRVIDGEMQKAWTEAGKPGRWSTIPVEKFFPHDFTAKIEQQPDFKAWLTAEIKKEKPNITAHELAMEIRQWGERNQIRKAGSIEHERKYPELQGYDTDPYKVFGKYIMQSSKRIPEIQTFGFEGEKLAPLKNALAERGTDTKIIDDMYEAMYATRPESKWNKVVDVISETESVSKISLGFFINMTQLGNSVIESGFKPLYKAITDYTFHPEKRASMHDIALLADAYDQAGIMGAEAGINPHMITQIALAGFKYSEQGLRFLAANAGRNRADDIAKILAKDKIDLSHLGAEGMYKTLMQDKAHQTLFRELGRLGLDARDILGNPNPELMEEALQKAAYNAVGQTQFRISPMSLPPSWRTNEGRLLTQFKSFTFMQTKFMMNNILKEASLGNWAPLTRYIAVAPIAYFTAVGASDNARFKEGSTTRSMWDKAHGREVNPKGAQNGLFTIFQKLIGTQNQDPEIKAAQDKQLFADLLKMSGTLPADVYANMSYFDETNKNEYKTDAQKLLVAAGNIGGPFVGDVASIGNAFLQAGEIQRENLRERPENKISPYTYPFGKIATSKLPYVGPALKNMYFGEFPQRQREIFKEAIKEALLTGDKTKINEVMQMNYTKNGRQVMKDALKEIRREQMAPEERARYEAMEKMRTERNYSPLPQ